MNLENMYEMQRGLDRKVNSKLDEGYVVGSYYDIDNVIYAFHTEVHELANEVGFFKFWKHSHEMDRSASLEELVDCIHLLLSLAIRKKYERMLLDVKPFALWNDYPLEDLFKELRRNELDSISRVQHAFSLLLGIAKKLDYTEMEIQYAYMLKNQTNLERQEENY